MLKVVLGPVRNCSYSKGFSTNWMMLLARKAITYMAEVYAFSL